MKKPENSWYCTVSLLTDTTATWSPVARLMFHEYGTARWLPFWKSSKASTCPPSAPFWKIWPLMVT